MILESLSLKEKMLLGLVAISVFAIMVLLLPETVPLPAFDEGWTLAVAKNWVEHGHYALQQNDGWVSATPMAQPFSVTMLVGLSMRMLGVGVFQGRLPIILMTVACIMLLFLFARMMFGRRSAWLTLSVLLVLTPNHEINPLFFGRQAIGEIPMLFYLLLGYLFWFLSIKGSKWGFVLAGLFWGLALLTKRQTLPFWLFSVGTILLVAHLRQSKNIFFISLASVAAAGISFIVFRQIELAFLGSYPLNGPAIDSGLYAMAFVTFKPHIRLFVLVVLPLFCLSTITGLVHASPLIWSSARKANMVIPQDWLKIALFTLGASWFFWFVFASLTWWRYYQPIFMISAPFCGKYISDFLTNSPGIGNKPNATMIGSEKKRMFYLSTVIFGFFIIEGLVFGPVFFLQRSFNFEQAGQLVADYIQEQTEANALIETYEGELLFFLERRVHYPTDQTQVELNRRSMFFEKITISYDPLAANPDYLIVGHAAESWGLYGETIQAGEFQFLEEVTGYKIYKRVVDQ